jgi:hypothetical protein
VLKPAGVRIPLPPPYFCLRQLAVFNKKIDIIQRSSLRGSFLFKEAKLNGEMPFEFRLFYFMIVPDSEGRVAMLL